MPDTRTRDHWIDAASGRLFARTWQPRRELSDVPVILLHDSLGSVELWRGFPAVLASHCGHSIIAYDRLGFGQSAVHPGQLAPDFVAAETHGGFAAVRDALNVSEFILFGHSVGGGMAVHCAAHHADDCRALITESAQAFVEDLTLRGVEKARTLFRDPDQVARLGRFHADKTQWVLDSWIDNWLNPDFASWTLDSVLPSVRCPVLAIHGAEDEYGTYQHPQRIADQVTGSVQIEIMPDTRHFPHRDNQTRVLELVGEFLTGLS